MSTAAERERDVEAGRRWREANGIPKATTDEGAIASAIALGIRHALKGPEALLRELAARVKDLEAQAVAQAATIKALDERALLHDGGIWSPGETYEAGAVVTHQGSAWVAEERHVSETEFSHECFRLMVKRGRSAR